MKVQKNVEISELTSFKNTGKVPKLLLCETIEDLKKAQKESQYFILGKGSNTLLNPNTEKTIIKLCPTLTEITQTGTTLHIPAATSVNKLMTLSKTHELSGLEFTAGVPASLGGMIAMNFGCWGKEIAQNIEKVHVLTPEGKTEWRTPQDLKMTYRHTNVQEKGLIIIEAALKLVPTPKSEIEKNIEKNIALRLEKQPLREPTFGSIFKNPENTTAGKLIDDAGLKNNKIGGAQISSKHANFMQNTGTATYEDAYALLKYIGETVHNTTKVQLTPEVQLP